MEEKVKVTLSLVITEIAALYAGTCTRSKGNNLLAGFMKLYPWSNACGKRGEYDSPQ